MEIEIWKDFLGIQEKLTELKKIRERDDKDIWAEIVRLFEIEESGQTIAAHQTKVRERFEGLIRLYIKKRGDFKHGTKCFQF